MILCIVQCGSEEKLPRVVLFTVHYVTVHHNVRCVQCGSEEKLPRMVLLQCIMIQCATMCGARSVVLRRSCHVWHAILSPLLKSAATVSNHQHCCQNPLASSSSLTPYVCRQSFFPADDVASPLPFFFVLFQKSFFHLTQQKIQPNPNPSIFT